MREKTTPREGKRRSVFLPWAEGKEKKYVGMPVYRITQIELVGKHGYY